VNTCIGLHQFTSDFTMEYILITNNVDIAQYAQDCGVHRIMVDLEVKGKIERQGHLNTLISKHHLDEIAQLRKVLTNSQLMTRINPIDVDSEVEINEVIASGVETIMLPMFKNPKEVNRFIAIINKRTKTNLLFETPASLARMDEIISIPGIDEVHIGLNDMHLGFNLNFMFELLSGGIIDYMAQKLNSKGIFFGFGGIARLGMGLIDSSLILGEHYRLNSKMVILSRDISGGQIDYKEFKERINLKLELNKLNDYYNTLKDQESEFFTNNQAIFKQLVRNFVNSKF